MKKLLIVGCSLLTLSLWAQNTEGTIEYEDVYKFEIELSEEMQKFALELPTENRANMVLKFTSKESLYSTSNKAVPPPPEKEDTGENGIQIDVQRVVIGGASSSTTYNDLSDGTGLRAEDVMGQKFLVTLPATTWKWKILDEQREILGYTCIKAELKEDSSITVAWFTPEIPVSVGPNGYGGLAGAILAMELSGTNGNVTIAATEVTIAPLKEKIEKPKKGKRITESEFDSIVEKRMESMRQMHGGDGEGGAIIIQIEEDVD